MRSNELPQERKLCLAYRATAVAKLECHSSSVTETGFERKPFLQCSNSLAATSAQPVCPDCLPQAVTAPDMPRSRVRPRLPSATRRNGLWKAVSAPAKNLGHHRSRCGSMSHSGYGIPHPPARIGAGPRITRREGRRRHVAASGSRRDAASSRRASADFVRPESAESAPMRSTIDAGPRSRA